MQSAEYNHVWVLYWSSACFCAYTGVDWDQADLPFNKRTLYPARYA